MMGGEASVLGLIQEIHKIKARDQESLRNAIRDVLGIKLQYIQEDEFDTGRRNLLNFGHCLGHALESTTNFAIPHGQAVLIGIIFANIVSRNRRLLSSRRNDFLNQELLLNSIHVNRAALTFSVKGIFEAMKMDKKRVADGLALIMMHDDFSMMKIQDLQQDELLASVKELGKVLDIPVNVER